MLIFPGAASQVSLALFCRFCLGSSRMSRRLRTRSEVLQSFSCFSLAMRAAFAGSVMLAPVEALTSSNTCFYNRLYIYIYIYTEPERPLFWTSNHSKYGNLSCQSQGHVWILDDSRYKSRGVVQMGSTVRAIPDVTRWFPWHSIDQLIGCVPPGRHLPVHFLRRSIRLGCKPLSLLNTPVSEFNRPGCLN